MEVVRLILVFLHLLGMAVLVGTFLVQRRTAPEGPLNAGWLHASLLQLVTGLALVGVNEGLDNDLDHAKIGVKLVVLLVILGIVVWGRRREALAPWVAPALAGLAVLNTGVAAIWT
ncbi:MAG TPA: hypothetical protein VGD67_05900 [Pseudonocardiaceae bacterium]